jgi:7,8-dihydropterin-6-yl-methyl-4-(beta-D-ribofuranosyl)aminobenzene 5'-phosphate synthase
MRLMTVMEDCGSEYLALHHEHGLSFFVDCGVHTYLFDFGPNGDTVKNSRLLNLPIRKVDAMIGSHGHYDHAGGYPDFVKAGCRQPLITGSGYFKEKYALDGIRATYLGDGFDESFLKKYGIEHRICKDVLQLSETEYVVGGFKRKYDFETIPDRFVIRDNGKLVRDDFSDEVCFVHKMKDGLFVLVGCSHPGILNILSTVEAYFKLPIIGVVGGTHLMEASEERIRKTIEIVKGFGLRFIGFNHCSGGLFKKIIEQDGTIKAVHLGAGDGLFL